MSLECELLHRQRFLSREAARTAVFNYIEGFYNRVRWHSSLGYFSPSDYEEDSPLRRASRGSWLPRRKASRPAPWPR